MLEQCRLCNGDNLKHYMSDGHAQDLHFYQCQDCQLVNYDLSLGVDQTQYTPTYVSPTVADNKSNVDGTQSWDYIRKRHPTPARFMDIGCGNGRLLYLAQQAGWHVKGLELSDEAARDVSAELGVEVAVSDFLRYDGDDKGEYDVVVLRHVLEHLPDSVLAMSKIGELLKPGGHALLEFPNTRSFAFAFKRFFKNRGMRNKKFAPEWRPGHVNEFCKPAFKTLLDMTGFELVDWRTYSNKPFSNALYQVWHVGSKARVWVRKSDAADKRAA